MPSTLSQFTYAERGNLWIFTERGWRVLLLWESWKDLWLKKSEVLEKLIQFSSVVKEAFETFQGIFEDPELLEVTCKKLEEIELKADTFVQEITKDIERVFILPLDKEDAKQIVDLLDDVVDNLEQVSNRIKIYRIKISQNSTTFHDFSKLIFESINNICNCIMLINKRKITSEEFVSSIRKLHDLENEGDKIHRSILEKMLGEGAAEFGDQDPILIIKLKEVFQTLEDTLDKCEDFAVVFERLRIKYR